ncbi:MAG: NB-ARC domain-containing protein [Caldilineaceae bacterium]
MESPLAAAPAEFEGRVHKALKFWYDSHPKEGLLDDLLIAHRAEPALALTRRQRTNLLLEQAIAYLAHHNPRDAELLKLRFCFRLPVEEARRQLNYAESTIYSKQNQAIARLAAILYGLETTAWHERAAQLAGRLESVPARLVGLDDQICGLATLLKGSSGPWVLSIEGIGGIGKTTLAAAVMRRLAAESAFEEFGWVSAQVVGLDCCGQVHSRPKPVLTIDALVAALAAQFLPESEANCDGDLDQQLARLRQRLAQVPHLITVDNFETMLDPHVLLPLLTSLANPSRFIITSRRRLIDEPNVHLHPVPELSVENALVLLRQAAEDRELSALAACADDDLLPIYNAVGGNPLALLLVVGQTHIRPLHDVLIDLAAAPAHPPATLFGYIYRQAWEGLSTVERQVLLAVCSAQVTDLDAASLGALCGLDAGTTTAALQRLIQANLVYMEGDLDSCRYRVHNLTYRFLRTVAAGWMAKG